MPTDNPVTSTSELSLDELLAEYDRSVPKYVRPPEDHKIYQLIGIVAAEWAHLEHVLDRTIWGLTGAISPYGACITAQLLGATNRYKTIIAQLHLRSKANDPAFANHIEAITKLMQKSYDVAERRNRIVHDAWYIDTKKDDPAQHKSMPHKDLRFGINRISWDEIQKTIADIKKLSARAEELRLAIDADYAAWRRIPPVRLG